MLYTKVLAYVMVGNDPENGVPQPTYITMWENARIIIAIALIIIEFFSFKNIQKGIIQIFNERQNEANMNLVNVLEETDIDTINNEVENQEE